MKRYILGFFTAAAAAAALWLLHRTFPCPLTALLTPVNGSPWEMGKLLYWPYLPAALVIWRMTPERQGRGGHCLLLAAMPLCMTGLCWLLPGRGLRLWSLILAGGLTLHGQVLVRRGAAVVCAGDPAGHRLSAADGAGPVGGTVRGPLRPCHGGYPVLRGGFLYLLHLPQNCGGKSGIIMLYVKRRR